MPSTRPLDSLVLGACAPFVALRGARIDGEAEEDVLIVVADERTLEGRVVDDHGMPLEGAEVSVFALVLDGFPLPLDGAWIPPLTRTRTDEDGRFVLEHAPTTSAVPVHFRRDGHASAMLRCLGESERPIVVELAQLSTSQRELHGVVVDAGGRAVAGARVTAGYRETTETSTTGDFALAWNGRASRLVATKRGFQPAVLEDLGEASSASEQPLVLTLGGPALEISGAVVGADGQPVAGWMVGLVDPTPLSSGGCAEERGAPAPPSDELRNRGALASTDAEGRFVVPGLADRAYRLRVYDPASALAVETEPVRAGERHVLVRVPADAVVAEVHGRVVNGFGEPVAEVEVRVSLVGSGGSGVMRLGSGPSAVTDADGRFVLRNMPRRHVVLGFLGDSIIEDQLAVAKIDVDQPLLLTVARRCGVRVVVGAGVGPNTRVHFEDGAGGPLSVLQFTAEYTYSTGSWSLDRGDSPVLTVSEHAATMVTSVDGREVARQPITLRPGEVVTLRAEP